MAREGHGQARSEVVNLAEATEANVRAVAQRSEPEMRALASVLQAAEKETVDGLTRLVKQTGGATTYTIHVHRAALYQIRRALDLLDHELAAAAAADLKTESLLARKTALVKLKGMIDAGNGIYRDSVTPLRLDIAGALQRVGATLMERHATSAVRYAGDVGRDIRRRLAIGLIRGETIDQLTSRLLRGGEFIPALQRSGVELRARVAGKRMFKIYRGWAERLVATELVHAYNAQQLDGILVADEDDPGYLLKWNAANDARVCPICHAVDGKKVRPGELFPVVQVKHAPAHPRCRCSVDPWRREWGN